MRKMLTPLALIAGLASGCSLAPPYHQPPIPIPSTYPSAEAPGARAASRQVMGTGVIGGMVFVTSLGIFFTPVFYYSARRWLSRDNDFAAQDALEEQNAGAASTPETSHA